MQRYQGGNPLAMAAVADGNRNAGMLYAYDHWTMVPGATLSYGARYASYDYLDRSGLFSPSVSFTVVPAPGFRVRTSVSRSLKAPKISSPNSNSVATDQPKPRPCLRTQRQDRSARFSR